MDDYHPQPNTHTHPFRQTPALACTAKPAERATLSTRGSEIGPFR
jgi:hypothetical protein